jgi:hypothetical protein
MAEDASIFRNFPRGVPGSQNGSAPSERFQDDQAVLNSAALRFSPDNREGKIFLGLAGASVVIDPKEPRLPDGRTNRYALGGALIGVGDDRHVITIAGSRAGKGRAQSRWPTPWWCRAAARTATGIVGTQPDRGLALDGTVLLKAICQSDLEKRS